MVCMTNKRKVTKEDSARFKRLHKNNSYMQIAFKTGFSMYTIRYHLNEKIRESIKKHRMKGYYKKKKENKNG